LSLGIQTLLESWNKCIAKHGDYIEKWYNCKVSAVVEINYKNCVRILIDLPSPEIIGPLAPPKLRQLPVQTAYCSRRPLRVLHDCHIQCIFLNEKLGGSDVQVLLNIHRFWKHGSCCCAIKERFRSESEVFSCKKVLLLTQCGINREERAAQTFSV
jgi:hypothetical protein